MAWLSVGTSNNDLIQKMIENGVFEEGPILEAFRVTDRGDFVTPEDRVQAYSDRPFKRGFIHLSAPHMYVTVLKALDLKSGKSFLNIGSGSGYLSCLAAFLLGEEGVSHGVEISESACQFSREKAKVWHAKLMSKLKEDEESLGTPMPPVISSDGIAFVSSNCFDIDILSAVSTMKYDRIYVGAGCPESRKEFFLSMLADDGIMVAPINEKNQMIVIRKFCGRVYNSKPISQVNFAPLLDTTVRADEPALLAELASMESNASLNSDIQQTIQKVQAASASSSFIFHPLPFTGGAHLHHHHNSNGSSPSSAMLSPAGSLNQGNGSNHNSNSNNRLLTEETVVRVRLPALVWAPLRRRHLQFPPDFRRAVFTILLANNQAHQYTLSSSYLQYMQYTHHDHQQQQQQQVNHYNHRAGPADRAWACLPHHIWLFIFTFASRDWFCVPKSEVQALSTELAVERRLRRSAEDKLRKAETARRTAEQERDMYRIALARMKQRSKHHATGNSHSSSSTGLGTALWAHGSFSDIDEFDEADEEEDEEENEGLMEDEEEEEEEEEEWNEEMENDVIEGEGEGEEEEEDSVTITDSNSSDSSSSTDSDGDINVEVVLEGEEEEEHDAAQGETEGDAVTAVAAVVVVGTATAGLGASAVALDDLMEEEEEQELEQQVDRFAPEEPFILPSATAMEEVTSPTTSFSTSISTASMPNEAHYGNISSSGVGDGALAWQQAATNSSAVPAFAAPIVPPPPSAQDTYFHHNYAYHYNDTHYQYQQLQHGNAMVAGSLSSDATCTTVESALSHNHNPSHRGMPTIISANTGNNTSRASALSFSAEERISDCTDNGDQPHEGEEEGDGEASGFDTSEQFTTDELL